MAKTAGQMSWSELTGGGNTTYDENGNPISSGVTSPGSVTGSAYDYDSTYGGKPNTADPATSAATAISDTTGNLSSLYDLADSANQFNANQAVSQQNTLTPGYSGNMDKWASDISDLLSGKVSSGTINTITQQAAERGVSSGIGGSAANESSLLRALGLTSEGQQQQGATQFASMINSSPKANAFDYSGYLTNANDVGTAQNQANTIASAANPATAGKAAIDAATSGVNTGSAAAGSAPTTTSTGTNSSIAQLLSSILGTGATSTTSGGNSATTANPATSNQSFEDWYNSVYGAGSYGKFGDTVATGDNYSDNAITGPDEG